MWQTIGHAKIIDLLQRAISQGSLSHAYLLAGPAQVGKMTLARDLAMTLNCGEQPEQRPCGQCSSCNKILEGKHADVQIVALNQNTEAEDTKERTEIGIDQIKDVLHSASLPPFEGKYRVYIIDEAGLLSMEAANCLLKTLEEPSAKVVFILLSSNPGRIPVTVISRCQRLNLAPAKTSEIESILINRWNIEPAKARLLARLSHGSPGWAIEVSQKANWLQERNEKFEKMLAVIKSNYSERFAFAAQLAQQFAKKREGVYETLDTWAGWWRDILLVKTGCLDDITNLDYRPGLDGMAGAYSLAQIRDILYYLQTAGEQLKLNANARLTLESLMLNIPKPAINKLEKPQVEVKHA